MYIDFSRYSHFVYEFFFRFSYHGIHILLSQWNDRLKSVTCTNFGRSHWNLRILKPFAVVHRNNDSNHNLRIQSLLLGICTQIPIEIDIEIETERQCQRTFQWNANHLFIIRYLLYTCSVCTIHLICFVYALTIEYGIESRTPFHRNKSRNSRVHLHSKTELNESVHWFRCLFKIFLCSHFALWKFQWKYLWLNHRRLSWKINLIWDKILCTSGSTLD